MKYMHEIKIAFLPYFYKILHNSQLFMLFIFRSIVYFYLTTHNFLCFLLSILLYIFIWKFYFLLLDLTL